MYMISVVVPVYNVNGYIERCIDSILIQSFREFELILVDDGSTDYCSKICDEYQQVDSRIKVIHKKNNGVSSARNFGIEVAQGDYLYFCDSDDYLERDCLAELLKAIEIDDSDCAVMNFYTKYDKYKKIESHSLIDVNLNSIEDRIQYINEFLRSNNARALFVRMLKTSIIKNNNLKMCESCENYAEDLGFYMIYLLYCQKIRVLDYAGYFFFFLEDSMMHKTDRDIKLNALNEVSHYFFEYLKRTYAIKRINKSLIFQTHFLLIYPQLIRFLNFGEAISVPDECKKIKKKVWYNKMMIKVIFAGKKIFYEDDRDTVFELKNLGFYTVHENYQLYSFINGLFYKTHKK